ncbi:MAG: hypothetical protein ACWA5K_03465 [bacterium]
MAEHYTYATIAGKYFCMDCSVLRLAWLVLFRKRRLQLDSLGIRRRQSFNILLTLLKFRLGILRTTGKTTFPLFGHICINVHQGYKFFDLANLSTTKLFADDVSADEANREIEAVAAASALEFAPTLLNRDANARWYSETFVQGVRSRRDSRSDPCNDFQTGVLAILYDLIQSQPRQTAELADYSQDLAQRLQRQIDDNNLDGELNSRLIRFTESTLQRIQSLGIDRIVLAQTHGDFSFVNFVYSNGRINVIDWEDINQRSLLHDLHNYFYTEAYYRRSNQDLSENLEKATESLMLRLSEVSPANLPASKSLLQAYGLIYYLERLMMLLDREPSAIRTRVITQTLDLFIENSPTN